MNLILQARTLKKRVSSRFEVLASVNTFVNTYGRTGHSLPEIRVSKRNDRMLKILMKNKANRPNR